MKHHYRNRENYGKELHELADDIRTERFLDKEDPDAPIVITKEQLKARRLENDGPQKGGRHRDELFDEFQGEPWANKLAVVLIIAFIGCMVCSVFGKYFILFGISAGMLLLAIPCRNDKRDRFAEEGTREYRERNEKYRPKHEPLFYLLSIAFFAAAIYMMKKM